jgi:hypothetical protein
VLHLRQRPDSLRRDNNLAHVLQDDLHNISTWFLIAAEDRMIAPETHRFMAARKGANARERPVDHTPLVTAPEEELKRR